MKVLHRTVCRLCNANGLVKMAEYGPIASPMQFRDTREEALRVEVAPISLSICAGCGHVQTTEVVDGTFWDGYTYQSGHAGVMPVHFRDSAERIIKRFKPERGSLVVDIGSNDGSFLRPFKEAGYRVIGIEMVKAIAEQASANGIETIGAPLSPTIANALVEKYGTASIVTAFNVMAHSDDLHSMARAVSILLGPEGVFAFEVQYLRDVFEKTLIATVFHEHLSHHSLKSMKRLLAPHGMQIIDVDRVPIQHGSIIGYAQLHNGEKKVTPWVDHLMAQEHEIWLDRPEALRKFVDDVAALRRKCEALVSEWKASGAKVAGYGAAMSGPGLISMLGLKGVIEYILDDHPQKVGKFSPGDGLPVVPTAELLARQPDCCVILAWVHAQRIIEQNQEYLARGGKFVVLCPGFGVVAAVRKVEAANA